jgi:hypothetical protein
VPAPEAQPALAAATDHAEPSAPRPSIFARLFRRRASQPSQPSIADLLAEAWERQSAAEAPAEPEVAIPAETRARLLSKLAEIPAEDAPAAEDEQDECDRWTVLAAEDDGQSDADDAASEGDPGPLTLSVMEVQAKLSPRPSQIRSFPWLRG